MLLAHIQIALIDNSDYNTFFTFQPKINFMKKRIYFMAIAIVFLLGAQGVRVSASESETDPITWCDDEGEWRGVCVYDTEGRAVCILCVYNQNCVDSHV
jgi:hypothetical protein